MTQGRRARRGAGGLRRPALRLRAHGPDDRLGQPPARRVVHAEPHAPDLHPAADLRGPLLATSRSWRAPARTTSSTTGATTVTYDRATASVTPADGGTPFALSDPSFNIKSLRGNAVLRWEYRPGSVLYFVWTQERTDFEPLGRPALRALDAAAVRRAGQRHLPGEGDVLPEPVARPARRRCGGGRASRVRARRALAAGPAGLQRRAPSLGHRARRSVVVAGPPPAPKRARAETRARVQPSHGCETTAGPHPLRRPRAGSVFTERRSPPMRSALFPTFLWVLAAGLPSPPVPPGPPRPRPVRAIRFRPCTP